MGYEYILKCECGEHKVVLNRWSHEVLVKDMTDFFERRGNPTYELHWDIFADVARSPREVVVSVLKKWIDGIKEELAQNSDDIPVILELWRTASGWSDYMYLECAGEYWEARSMWDKIVAQPIDGSVVRNREADAFYRAVVVSIDAAQLHELGLHQRDESSLKIDVLERILENTPISMTSEPLGRFLEAEIDGMVGLVQHSVQSGERVYSYCI